MHPRNTGTCVEVTCECAPVTEAECSASHQNHGDEDDQYCGEGFKASDIEAHLNVQELNARGLLPRPALIACDLWLSIDCLVELHFDGREYGERTGSRIRGDRVEMQSNHDTSCALRVLQCTFANEVMEQVSV